MILYSTFLKVTSYLKTGLSMDIIISKKLTIILLILYSEKLRLPSRSLSNTLYIIAIPCTGKVGNWS